VRITSPSRRHAHGMAFLTEDRKETGCFLNLDCIENIQVALLSTGHVDNRGFVNQREVNRLAEEYGRQAAGQDPEPCRDGGEPVGRQPAKAADRALALTKPRILILDEPTRGIDVGAKSEIHRLITQLAGQGVAVLMISSELPEVLGMSDRIMVMHEGHVSGFLDRAEADQVRVMELAAK
jgi:inositol transport system ATP-binding protein